MRILFVDDDINIREALGHSLRMDGHEVVEASNGLRGLREYERNGPFDRVLTDFQMPGMDGGTLALRIREKDPNMIIVVASGDSSNANRIPKGVTFLRKGSISREVLNAALKL